MNEIKTKTYEELEHEINSLQEQLSDANDTIEAIRTGQIDALVVKEQSGHSLYTLKTADQTYRVFIEKMPEGAVTLNGSGIILYSNSKFASMVGCPLSTVIGHSFEDFVVQEHKDIFRRIFKRSWQEDIKTEVTLNCGESSIPVQISLTTLNLDGGFSLNVIVTDLSAQKEAQRQLSIKNQQLESLNNELSQSNHDLQQFASVASHDLQEPLRKIQIFSKFLRDKDFDVLSANARQNLDKIISSAQRMKVLILDILNYSRLSATNTHYEPTDLNQMLKDILDDFEIKIGEKKATITIEPLPLVEVNPGQMRQVFQNLISNALKFSREDEAPRISIMSGEITDNGPTPSCRIIIRDNGIGFEEKYAATIFSLFEKLHSKDMYEGTGIGLAITKKIIDKHNGQILAKGIEGKGAEFIIVLPLRQHNQSADK
jgi:two-component system CheB/CheR fusion protein